MLALNPKPRNVDEIIFESNFLSQKEISSIHSQAQATNYQDGVAGDPESPAGKEIRSSKIKWLPPSPDWQWLYNKIADKVLLINEKAWGFDLSTIPDRIQYSAYHAHEKGHYTWHSDVGPGMTSYRKIAVVIPLTPTHLYEGGRLEFNSNYKPAPNELDLMQQAGCINLFPSFVLHRVSPVTKGTRHSLVTWIGGVPFR